MEARLDSGYGKRIVENGKPTTTYPNGWFDFSHGRFVSIKSLSDVPLADLHTTHRTTAPNAHDWLDGYYDDDMWWALAWLNAYDVTGDPWYLSLAEGIFSAITKVWPTHCGNGGIYWAVHSGYVNAISNELFFSTAASLTNRVEDKKKRKEYMGWTKSSLEWFMRSGMITGSGLINDGLTNGCVNNNKVRKPRCSIHTSLKNTVTECLNNKDSMVLQPRRHPRRPSRTTPCLPQRNLSRPSLQNSPRSDRAPL